MGDVVGKVANIFTGADNTKAAGEAAAAQQSAAAKAASAAAAFRPVGMTTRFGTSQFTREIDPATGMPYVSGASYTAAPELSALQNKLFGQMGAFDTARLTQAAEPLYGGAGQAFAGANQILGTAGTAFGGGQNLFGLGGQYLAQSPEQTRADYIATQQAALAPSQEQQLANIRNQLYQTGRSGLATGGTSQGMAATNPEMAAYYNSLQQQNLNIATQAEQAAQQRQAFGAGLQAQGLGMFGTGAGLLSSGTGLYGQGAGLLGQIPALQTAAYSPLQTILGLSGTTEQMSQMPLQLGIQLGQAQQPGQTAGAQMYQGGMNQAAQTQYGATQAANAANAGFWGGLMQAGGMAASGGLFGGGGGGGGLMNWATRQMNQASPDFVGPPR